MWIALALCLLLPPVGISTVSAGPATKQLRLRASSFDPVAGEARIPARLHRADEPEAGHFVVQFRRSIDRGLIARLRAAGAEIVQYVPDDSYLIRVPRGRKSALRGLPEVRWLGPVQPGWKLSPDLGHRPFKDAAQRRTNGRLYATVDLFEGADLEAAVSAVVATGAELLQTDRFSDTQRLRVHATPEQLEQVAWIDEVGWIEEVGEITSRNAIANWTVQTDVTDSTAIWDHGLHGEGQILGHIDGRLDRNSCYFIDPMNNTPRPDHRKIVAYRSSSGFGADGHGTHTAGTLAGDRFPIDGSTNWNGHAFAARISHSNLADITGVNNTPSNLYTYLALADADGARLHTNSWGDDGVSSYSTWARDADLFSYDFEDSLVVFATTNGAFLRSPENAKNVLATGASQNGLSADSFCSGGSGPTGDGRRKPEIYAPGCNIVSALSGSSCSVGQRTGTSMASPAVTAMGALARQYFVEGWYPSGSADAADSISPSAALIKSVLLNSTVDMANVAGYPSNLEGWGRVVLDNALYFDGDLRNLAVLADLRNALGLSTGITNSFPLVVSGDTEALKITMTFTDPPGSLLSLSPTVNDLDLEVVSPGGAVYKGNAFSTATGESIVGGVRDPLNNVEMVRVVSPELGEWTVNVIGTGVNQGTQGYALVATGQLAVSAEGVVRYSSHTVDDSGALANDDGVVDPGETIILPVTLLNLRSEQVTGVSAKTFAADSSEVKVSDGEADYPNMDSNAAAESLSPHYRLTLAPDLACGSTVRLDLSATYSAGQDDSSLVLSIGSSRLDSVAEDVPVDLPAFSGVPATSTIQIDDDFTISDVEVAVNVEHQDISELVIDLTSPAATKVTLHNHSDSGVADLDVVYPVDRLPDGPGTLSLFNGQSSQGTWTLSLLDLVAGVPMTPGGTLVEWSLALTFSDGLVCSPLDCAGDPVPLPVAPTMSMSVENGTDLRFDWAPASGAAAYRIWRSAHADFSREELAGETGATTFLASGAVNESYPYYRVNAINSCEWEAASDCGGDPLPREVGQTMLLGKENGTDVRLDWSAVPDVAGYRVITSGTPDFATSMLEGETPTTTFSHLGGLIGPSTTFYLVNAINSCDWEGP